MRSITLVLLLLNATAVGAAEPGADAPARDCSLYSLEGISVGMSLEEVRSAVPGGELSKRDVGVPKDEKGRHWTLKRGANKKQERTRIWMSLVLDESGRVVSLENSYIDVPTMGQVFAGSGLIQRVPADELVAAFSERFGAPTSDEGVEQKAAAEGVKAPRVFGTRTVTWDDAACDRIARVEAGSTWGVGEELPILTGAITKRSWWKPRAAESRDKKIKF